MLVSAPAGFGKTTLLTEWLAAPPDGARRSAAWLSLDAGDNDPARFWTYVIAGLRTLSPDDGRQRARPPPVAPGPAGGGGPHDAASTTSARIDGDVVLVLDDYHLIESGAVHEAMTFLLDHLPPQLHLVIATRADPPLSLARLRARGELVEVRAAELRFTADEAAAYLNESMGLELDRRATSSRSRGARRAGSPHSSSPRCRCRDATTPRSSSPASPVTTGTSSTTWSRRSSQRQPRDVQDFLLRTSVLSRLSGPLCDAVSGEHRREGDAAGAGARQPLPRPARRPAPVVPLPPPLRRRPAGAAAGRGSPSSCRSCTVGRAGGTPTTASPRRRSGTRWPAATSRAPRTWWSGA